ncbi:MAG: uroporphyrinogen-III synthase [Rickettsiales bacterium]|nr:uroporphyrinogen-III synthase [Rickettsiales bacterium]
MKRPTLLLTRPLAESERTAQWLLQAGFNICYAPCMSVIHRPPPTFMPMPQAIILTSQQAVHGLASTMIPRELPIYVVGEFTQQQVQALGYHHVNAQATSAIDLPAILHRYVTLPARLIYLRGHNIQHDLHSSLTALGYEMGSHVMYEAQAIDSLPADAIDALCHGDVSGILFYSARTVTIFAMLLEKAAIAQSQWENIPAIVISDAVAQLAIKAGFTNIHPLSLQYPDAALPALKTLFF